ncbi:MAG TPA: hypothetical protein VIY48_16010 [Candidatus Paceibacterota bacterium]
MGTPMNTKEKARFVLPIIRREWDQEMRNPRIASPAFQFFGIDGSTASVEYSQGLGAFDLVPEYNSATAEGAPGAVAYDSFAELYETTFTHKEYAKGVAIERKLFDDDQRGNIRRKAQSLGLAFGRTRASHASSVFNNAFSSSYVGADAVSLCNDSHPVNKVSTSTFDNKGTSALSYTSIVSTLIAGQDMNDDRGNPMPIIYDTVLVPTALQATAYEAIKPLLKPGTGNNDANALNYINGAPLNVVVDPYLTDSTNWFMIDSQLAKQHLLWFNRVLPGIEVDPASNFNLVVRYVGYMRYSFGWDDARWIYGHEVAGG